MLHFAYMTLAELQAVEGGIGKGSDCWSDLSFRQQVADQNMAPAVDRDVQGFIVKSVKSNG